MYIIKKSENISDAIQDFTVSDLLEEKIIHDRNNNSYETEFRVLCNIKIDKKSLILKDIKKAELYMTKESIEVISQRIGQNNPSDIEEFNKSIINGNLNRLNTLKSFFGMSTLNLDNLTFIEDIDLSLSLDKATINKVKSGRIPDADAFGVVEYYKTIEKSKISNNSSIISKKKKDYFETIKDNATTDEINSRNIISLISKLKKSGIDILSGNTTGLIKYIEQEKMSSSVFQKISGNFNRIFQKNNIEQFYKNFLTIIKKNHSGVAKQFFEDNQTKKLSVVKEINRIENLKKQFIFKKKLLNSGTGTLIVVLYDKTGLRSEIKMVEFDINDLVRSFRYPEFDYEFSVSKENTAEGKKIIGNIYNNENIQREYIVSYEALGENSLNKYDSSVYVSEEGFKNKQSETVPAKSSKSFVMGIKDTSKNYSFQSRIYHNSKVYSNAKYSICKNQKKSLMHKTSFIDFLCINKEDNIRIVVRNLPNEIKYINVLQKNLTKKQKSFNRIGTNVTVVNNEVEFIDKTVEDKDTYEYKVEQVDLKGNIQISSNSFIEKYCKNKNLGNLTTNIVKINTSAENITYSIDISYDRKESDNDKVIKSLTGNFFSLFENVLTSLNQQTSVVIDAQVSAYNHVTGEIIDYNPVSLIEDKGNLVITLPRSTYTIKVSSRFELPQTIITALATAQQQGINIDDIFLDKETGNVNYYYTNDLLNKISADEITYSQNTVSLIKTTANKNNRKKKNISFFDYYDASFTLSNYYNLDYFIMSYSENNFSPIIYGIGYCPRFNYDNTISYNFSYKIPTTKGTVIFMAQPIYIDGNLGTPFIVGSVTKE